MLLHIRFPNLVSMDFSDTSIHRVIHQRHKQKISLFYLVYINSRIHSLPSFPNCYTIRFTMLVDWMAADNRCPCTHIRVCVFNIESTITVVFRVKFDLKIQRQNQWFSKTNKKCPNCISEKSKTDSSIRRIVKYIEDMTVKYNKISNRSTNENRHI